MEKTWRWFGAKDRITLDLLREIGVEGIVTALHDIPNGEVWPLERIEQLRDNIASHGLRWSVVESLPVSESIKYAGEDRDQLIENYKISLANLGKAGVKTVCYNFMPVLDWARTDLMFPNGKGSWTLHFNKARFAYFDIHILKRVGAAADYNQAILDKVAALDKVITEEEKQALVENIIVKTQGFVSGNISEKDNDPVEKFRQLLALYEGIDKDQLRANMKYFLEQVVPVAKEWGIGLCVHPDDPPMPVLGLPRIVCSEEDIDWLFDAVDEVTNGLTFCAGSLSSGLHNDVPAMARKYAKRVHFAHLRSTEVDDEGNFTEASHLGGRANIIELVRIFERENPTIPMRVDHAPTMTMDLGMGDNAGYPCTGRMYALAQVDAIMATVRSEQA